MKTNSENKVIKYGILGIIVTAVLVIAAVAFAMWKMSEDKNASDVKTFDGVEETLKTNTRLQDVVEISAKTIQYRLN